MTHTAKQTFNKVLEIQQSKHPQSRFINLDLVAGFDPSTQTAAIEDLMAKDVPITDILRLLCLQHLVGGNLKSKDIENLKRRFLQVHLMQSMLTKAYGYQHLLTLDSLAQVGLLQGVTTANKSAFPNLRKSLRLIVDEVNEQKPDDISYVYSGYAPLSIRLVQCIIQKHVMLVTQSSNGAQGRITNTLSAFPNALGWRGFEEPLKLVNGKTFDEIQKQEDKAVRAKSSVEISCIADYRTSQWCRIQNYSGFLPRWVHLYRDRRTSIHCKE
jgi:vacuolar protein sorting-associated protein 33A